MLDVHQLRVLKEVARTGSYTAAASSLGYTQPAVSYQMRRLQQAVGAPLVVKAGRALRLTEIGAVLVRHADAVFSTLRAADQEVALALARGSGLVRIAAFQSSCVTLVPELVARLRARHPEVRVTVVQAEPADARRMVRSGEVDLGLLCNWEGDDLPEGEGAMLRTELMRDRRCVLMREDDPLAAQSTVDLIDLADYPWVMETFRDRFLAACATAGFQPSIVASVDDVSAIQALVASGLGVSLVSDMALHTHLASGLVRRPLRPWPLRHTYALLWPDMAGVSAVQAALEETRAVARSFEQDGFPET
ncbi:LysR family transcriptional regulator [Streptomyces sp. NPDC057694]|uniref:LysR family transcriptional regulator n=1 Tax=Streptomyces sp. NPDC057694 TaxID=3346216 RepID=UPI0036B21244